MNQFALSSYVSGIATFLIGLLVYLQNKRLALHRIFFVYSVAITVWALLTATHSVAGTREASLFCAKMMHLAVPLIPVLFFNFVLIFLRVEKERWLRFLLYGGYGIAAAIGAACLLGELFVGGVRPKLGYTFFMDGGPLYFWIIVFFIVFSISGLLLLVRAMPKSVGVRRTQLHYLFWGSLIGYVLGVSNFLPVYNVTIFPYPYGSLGITFYVFITAYAIAKYKLLEVEVIIRRTLVFAGLLAFVFGVFSFGLFITQEVLAVYFGFKWELALAISLFLIVLGYEPMRTFLIETTDRYLFQKKYDYQKVLKDAATGIAQIESLHRLLGLVTHFLTLRIRVKNAAVLTRSLKSRDFLLGYERGYPREGKRVEMLSPQSQLIRYLDQEREGLEIERVKELIETGGKRPKKKGELVYHYDYYDIKHQMEELRAACCIPSFLGKELRNILILGEKKSGDYYSQEDLNVLFTLAQQSAIAIENARLYDEAVNKSKELEKINQELETAKVSLVHALEETEKANKQLQDTQAQLIHEQKMATLGRLAASVGHEVNNPLTILSMNVSRAIIKHRKDPNLKVTEIADFFQKMEQNIGRIKAVVNTLTGLLKKSEKGKFEPLSLKLLLEETLPLVQFQTYLENPSEVEVDIDIPSSTPLVKGDLERLQEVFLNLFINAYQAMMGRRSPKITVRAHPMDHKMVAIDFSDNGSGMTEETQKKIFTYGFTTKGPGRGSGMGLYICKYIIELHGGEIKVKSEPGRGTTFSLTLPVFEEPSQVGLPSEGYTTG